MIFFKKEQEQKNRKTKEKIRENLFKLPNRYKCRLEPT